LVDRIYAAVEAHVRGNPEQARCAWRMAGLHVGRIS
jgi:hypothetical protein